MKRNRGEKKHRSGEIPTGSFSDIAFLLIIYFLVATTLVKVKTITADLPSGEKSSQSQSSDTPTVSLKGDLIMFKDKKVDLAGLNDRLLALDLFEQEGSKKVILLESTKGTPYNNYFQVLATISANGGVVALVEDDK